MFARSLKTTFTAGILATTLALTSLAPTNAQAGLSDEDIAGLLTLLVIGAAIHNSRNNDVVTPQTHPEPQQPRAWRVLPARCERDIRTLRGGTVRMFMDRCLNNNYRHVDRLPQSCHVNVRTADGQSRRHGFRAQCLRNAGFRTTRH